MSGRRHLLELASLSTGEIERLLDLAESFDSIGRRQIKKVPTLRGRTVVNLFMEASTRTRSSFELAAKRLSADTLNISGGSSSVVKGETLLDTALNLAAYRPDIIVLRHQYAGAPHLLAQHINASIVNAGDGAHEHPTQGLLDLLTIRQHKRRIAGLKVAIIGDITHSRVARSGIVGLSKLGAEVVVCGPPTMVPVGVEALGCRATHQREEAVADADVVMMLRIQKERLAEELFPSDREYARYYGLNREVLRRARPDCLVMHPGPINRGVELDADVADGPQSVILDQVSAGVAVRMAVLYHCAGGGEEGGA
ncbi:MAG: aspartate carbamoyltransferase catalytic subunit [Myxococcales bacterium]|nr:aspartate carbamoyltransferase catalytic subunit [Myxococcales bacterium]MCB9524342.1 aspartate carbamoyltransferase catalytic subunit [Myxococcales bacterium]